MQYLKLGPFRIPYNVKIEGHKKYLQVAGLRLPFSSYTEGLRKYYRIGPLRFSLRHPNKRIVNQGQLHYRQRQELTEDGIHKRATAIFQEKLGYVPDLEHPRSMNEKILWLKLHHWDPRITRCCDKFRVKDYVTEKLGPGYVIPTIQNWNRPEDVDFSALPERFVLKVNWSSGYNILVTDRGTFNEAEAQQKIAHWMAPAQNSYYENFNWGYRDMLPVVYAEEYLEQPDGQLYDYKFFCCDGKVRFWFIATDRHGEKQLTHDFFDMDFNHLDFDYGGRAHASQPLEKPVFYEEMIRCAEILSEPFPFVRVDFYETNGRFYVGEMTFYPGGGILAFEPREWDYRLGEYINLPHQDRGGSVHGVVL